MRVLLDENPPVEFALELTGVTASTVAGEGWSGITNGELLRRIAGHFDVLLTMDRNLQHQQNVSRLSFGVLVIRAPSNRIRDLRPLIPAVLERFPGIQSGEIRVLGA